jgi:hypothetical protein
MEGKDLGGAREEVSVQITSLSTHSGGGVLLPEPDELDDGLPRLPVVVSATATATVGAGAVRREGFASSGSNHVFPDMVEGLKRGPGTSPGGIVEHIPARASRYEDKVGLGKMLQLAQSKLIEHGFPALEDAQILQADQEIASSSSASAVQCLLHEAVKRVIETLEQYGQRGQLVQELILSAETAVRRNERLTVDNKELALQVTDFRQSVSTGPSVDEMQRMAHDLKEMEKTMRDAVARKAQADEEIKELQAKLVDIRQDLAVSLKREAGMSAELKRLEHEHASERERLELKLDALRRKETSVISLVEDKERRLEQCQERLRSVVEEEERRREEALLVLKTFPRRNAPGATPTQRRGAAAVGGGGGAWAGDMRAAAVVASLMDQVAASTSASTSASKISSPFHLSKQNFFPFP